MKNNDTNNDAIVVTDLVKSFQNVKAVRGISFSVKRGQITGIIGGNGAGKTTTISMILGMLTPTSGTIKVLGCDIACERHKILHRMNFESPYVDMPLRLNVRQNLNVYAKIYGIENRKAKIEQMITQLELATFADRPLGTLSAGQKTRTNLAKALLNEPELLLLDEPTASLDPVTGNWIRQHLVKHCREKNAAILLTSHNMNEVEKICDYILVMKNGTIPACGTAGQIMSKYKHNTLEEAFIALSTD